MREYTIRVEEEGVKSPHSKLSEAGKRNSHARKWNGESVDVEGPDDAVSDLIAYLVYQAHR